jgi:hypothetical protein
MLPEELRSHSVYTAILYSEYARHLLLQELIWLVLLMCYTCTIKFSFTSPDIDNRQYFKGTVVN